MEASRIVGTGMNVEGRVYGGDGTIHGTNYVDVEVLDGKVVAVWFRCQPLAFEQYDVEEDRAKSMRAMYEESRHSLNGVIMEDTK